MTENLGHFKTQVKKKRNPPTKFDIAAAKKLHKALKVGNFLNKDWNPETWFDSFRKLRTVDGMDKARIKKVLFWYCKNIRIPYVPTVIHANSFRSKFISLEAAMDRAPLSTSVNKQKIKITKEAHQVNEYTGWLIWPDKNKEQCPELEKLGLAVIQASLNNYKKYFDMLYDLSKRKSTPDHLTGIMTEIYTCEASPKEFVTLWMIEIHRMAWTWKGWKGNLENYVFNYNSNRYQEHAEKIAAYYCGDPNRWNEIKELLNSESTKKEGRGR